MRIQFLKDGLIEVSMKIHGEAFRYCVNDEAEILPVAEAIVRRVTA